MQPKSFRTKRRRHRGATSDLQRTGTTAVEFAIVFPVILTICFGLFELSRLQTISDTTRTSVILGAREAMVLGASADDVRTKVDRVLRLFSVSDSVTEVTPEDFSEAEEVTIRVEVPVAGNQSGFVVRHFLPEEAVIEYSITVSP